MTLQDKIIMIIGAIAFIGMMLCDAYEDELIGKKDRKKHKKSKKRN